MKIHKHNIKRLSLNNWMKHNIPDHYRPVNPVFHKEGIYLSRISDISWFEVFINGIIKAYLYDIKSFQYDLSTLNASEYNTRVHQALKSIAKVNIATKKQLELLGLMNTIDNQKYQRLSHFRIKKRINEWIRNRRTDNNSV
jgi:hypothetical protein